MVRLHSNSLKGYEWVGNPKNVLNRPRERTFKPNPLSGIIGRFDSLTLRQYKPLYVRFRDFQSDVLQQLHVSLRLTETELEFCYGTKAIKR